MIRLLRHSSLSQASPTSHLKQTPTPSQRSSIVTIGLDVFAVLDWISHQKAAAADSHLEDLTSLTSAVGLLLYELLYSHLDNIKLGMQQICR